jgi:hypothetical protein
MGSNDMTTQTLTLSEEEQKQLSAIRERNKTHWKIIDSRYGEIAFLMGLVERAYKT